MSVGWGWGMVWIHVEVIHIHCVVVTLGIQERRLIADERA